MDKYIILMIFTAWTTYSVSQTYYPLIEEDKSWNVLAVSLGGPLPWDPDLSTVSYRVPGNTSVNEILYKKIYSFILGRDPCELEFMMPYEGK